MLAPMSSYRPITRPQDLIGQADTVLASLEKQPWLPAELRLHIEEAVETAWEVAFRRERRLDGQTGSVVVSLSAGFAQRAQSACDTQRAAQRLSGALSQLAQAEARRPPADPADNVIHLAVHCALTRR